MNKIFLAAFPFISLARCFGQAIRQLLRAAAFDFAGHLSFHTQTHFCFSGWQWSFRGAVMNGAVHHTIRFLI